MGKISYYLRRVSKAEPAEVFYRLKWKVRSDTYDRLVKSRKNGIDYFERNDYSSMYRDFLDGKYAHLLKSKGDGYADHFDKDEAVRLADSILDGNISIFDVDIKTSKIDWNKDYKNKKRYPRKFATDFYHEDPRSGMVRYVWELNRQYQVVVLGKAFILTKDEKYAKHAVRMILDWTDQNPYLYSINWFSPLELSVRGMNWIWCLGLLKGSKALDSNSFSSILDSLYLHAITVASNISRYSSANNHLMGELAFLKMISSVFPQLNEADRWGEFADKGLDEEVFNQFLSDGVGAEQSTNYLMFSVSLFVDAMMVAHGKMPKKYHPRLLNISLFLHTLMQNWESMPEIGDSDYASIPMVSGQKSRADETINAIRQLCNRKPFKKSEYGFWLTGIPVTEFADEPSHKSHYFGKGGYLVSLSNVASLIFDCGSVGYLSTSGHGHCDMLSFIFAVSGKEFFVDPGTYVYHGNPTWRNYFKSTAAHNTVRVGDEEQSEILGNFIYGKKASCKVKAVESVDGMDKIAASHDGYKDLGVIHEREIAHDRVNRRVWIADNLGTSVDASLFFNLHPDVKLIEQDGYYELVNGDVRIKLALPEGEIKIWKGSDDPIHGWYSPEWGVKVESITIEVIPDSEKFESVIEY